MIDEDLRELMTDTITIEPYAGQNVNTEESYGAGVDYTCRCVGKRRLVRTVDGREAISEVQAHLDQIITIDPRSRLTLPVRFTPSQPRILAVQMLPDEGVAPTLAHTVVFA